MRLTPSQRRFLRNLRDNTGLTVAGVRPTYMQRRGLITRDTAGWAITDFGRVTLLADEAELHQRGEP